MTEHHNVIIQDGAINLFEAVKNRKAWRHVGSDYSHDLWDVIASRCADL